MDKIKSASATLLAIAFLIGGLIFTVLFFATGATVAFVISPFINALATILFVITLIILVFAIYSPLRGPIGLFIYFSSYVHGIATWIYGLAVALALWGWLAVIVGLFLGGVGVVPVGLLASVFNGRWDLFSILLFTLILTYGTRVLGYALITNADARKTKQKDKILVSHEEPTRRWEDIS